MLLHNTNINITQLHRQLFMLTANLNKAKPQLVQDRQQETAFTFAWQPLDSLENRHSTKWQCENGTEQSCPHAASHISAVE